MNERRELPTNRRAITHKFTIDELEGFIIVGLYDDGTPGEIFLHISKEGSTLAGMCDGVAAVTSIALQYGVPLERLVRRFSGQKFEPSGLSGNPAIGHADSILDYVFRWLGMKFLAEYEDFR